MKKWRQLMREYEELASALEKPFVLGDGPKDAEVVLIGEAPGKDEVMLGRPFMGKAGKNLQEFLETVGLRREALYVTNVVKFRPTKQNDKTGRISNRPPTRKEIELFTPLLHEELMLVAPRLLITLGNVALQAVTGKGLNVGEVHGTCVLPWSDEVSAKVFPLYHPASIIYNPALKTVYHRDLLLLKRFF